MQQEKSTVAAKITKKIGAAYSRLKSRVCAAPLINWPLHISIDSSTGPIVCFSAGTSCSGPQSLHFNNHGPYITASNSSFQGSTPIQLLFAYYLSIVCVLQRPAASLATGEFLGYRLGRTPRSGSPHSARGSSSGATARDTNRKYGSAAPGYLQQLTDFQMVANRAKDAAAKQGSTDARPQTFSLWKSRFVRHICSFSLEPPSFLLLSPSLLSSTYYLHIIRIFRILFTY